MLQIQVNRRPTHNRANALDANYADCPIGPIDVLAIEAITRMTQKKIRRTNWPDLPTQTDKYTD